ncbi:hypothetical protein [Chryseobacterium sp.]|uniref:hypothetical protein n=1 Tax=Chryseobacterium sp. TaxID=1871047 RepID=UPI000EE6000E|nr:hypothetical protein [Chryseobacterium sp.]HCA09848.1 hypothetical protein [Chryseobacterium sp.]
MKKTILLGTLFLTGVVSAFPFRTSCGKIYEVSGTQGMSLNQVASELSDINLIACGERPSSIVIYSH